MFPGGLAVKEAALSVLWFRFDPWIRNFPTLWAWQKKKKEKEKGGREGRKEGKKRKKKRKKNKWYLHNELHLLGNFESN